MISPRINCSVKFLEPTMMRSLRGGPQDRAAIVSSNVRTIRRIGLVRSQSLLEQTEAEIRDDGEQRSRNRSCQDHLVVHHPEAAEDQLSETARSDGSGNRSGADRNYDRNTNTCDDDA